MHVRAVLKKSVDRWNIQRYVLAAHKIFYWNQKKTEAEGHLYRAGDKGHPGTWDDLCRDWLLPKNLLTQAEADLLGAYKGNRCNALFAMYESRVRLLLAAPAGESPGAADRPSLPLSDVERSDFFGGVADHLLAIKGRMANIAEVRLTRTRTDRSRHTASRWSPPVGRAVHCSLKRGAGGTGGRGRWRESWSWGRWEPAGGGKGRIMRLRTAILSLGGCREGRRDLSGPAPCGASWPAKDCQVCVVNFTVKRTAPPPSSAGGYADLVCTLRPVPPDPAPQIVIGSCDYKK